MVELFRDTFCWLPLAHVLDKRVLVMHGGLFSKDGVKLSDIRSIDRHRSVHHLFCICVATPDTLPIKQLSSVKGGVVDILVASAGLETNNCTIELKGNLVASFSSLTHNGAVHSLPMQLTANKGCSRCQPMPEFCANRDLAVFLVQQSSNTIDLHIPRHLGLHLRHLLPTCTSAHAAHQTLP